MLVGGFGVVSGMHVPVKENLDKRLILNLDAESRHNPISPLICLAERIGEHGGGH